MLLMVEGIAPAGEGLGHDMNLNRSGGSSTFVDPLDSAVTREERGRAVEEVIWKRILLQEAIYSIGVCPDSTFHHSSTGPL